MPETLTPPSQDADSLRRARLEATAELRETIDALYGRGWALGTSGNFSVVLSRSPLRLLITASGRDKGRLSGDDFLVVDHEGRPIEAGRDPATMPSAETLL